MLYARRAREAKDALESRPRSCGRADGLPAKPRESYAGVRPAAWTGPAARGPEQPTNFQAKITMRVTTALGIKTFQTLPRSENSSYRMSSRRGFLVAAAAGVLLPHAVQAQQVGTAPGHALRTDEQEVSGLTGQLLVATEDIRDPRFERTVIYMVHSDSTGAMGFVVNRPLGDVPMARVLERLGRDSEGVAGTIRIHYGGPVEPGRGSVLHTTDWASPEGRVIRGTVALDQGPAILDAIAHRTGPRRFLFTLGYAGWGPGQLEAEIAHGAWITVAADEALVFDEDNETKWERATARRRIDL